MRFLLTFEKRARDINIKTSHTYNNSLLYSKKKMKEKKKKKKK